MDQYSQRNDNPRNRGFDNPREQSRAWANPYSYQEQREYQPEYGQQAQGPGQMGRAPGRSVRNASTDQGGWQNQQSNTAGAFGSQYGPGTGQRQQYASPRQRPLESLNYYGGQNQNGPYGGQFHNDEWSRPEDRMQTPPVPFEPHQQPVNFGSSVGYLDYGGYNRPRRGRMVDIGRPEFGYEGQYGPQTEDYAGVAPMGYQRSAASIRDEVCQSLTEHPAANPSQLEVDVDDDGIVTLSGHVDSRYTKRLVEDIADFVRGVRDVNNRLVIDESKFSSRANSSSSKSNGASSSSKSKSKSKSSSN